MTVTARLFHVFFAATLCLGLSQPTAAIAESKPFRIGSILILTGEGASWGTAARNGMDLAIEDLNANGGILGRKVEAVHQDDQGDPKNSISAFRHLTDVEGIRFIIGPTWSHSGLALIDRAHQKKVVIISPSLGKAKFNESSNFLFNTYPHDFLLAEGLAEHVYAQGHRKVAVIGAQDVWVEEQTTHFKQRFESLGGNVALVLEPLPGTVDLRTEALKISKAPNIDALVSTTNGVIIGSLVTKALKDLKFKIPTYSVTLDQAAIDASQGGLDGAEFVSSLTPTKEFAERYEKAFKTSIDIGGDSAYDAVMLLAAGIKQANSFDTEAVATALLKIKSFDGVSGKLTADGKGGFEKPFVLKTIVKGKAVTQE